MYFFSFLFHDQAINMCSYIFCVLHRNEMDLVSLLSSMRLMFSYCSHSSIDFRRFTRASASVALISKCNSS
jgi:hypothetical protein